MIVVIGASAGGYITGAKHINNEDESFNKYLSSAKAAEKQADKLRKLLMKEFNETDKRNTKLKRKI